MMRVPVKFNLLLFNHLQPFYEYVILSAHAHNVHTVWHVRKINALVLNSGTYMNLSML